MLRCNLFCYLFMLVTFYIFLEFSQYFSVKCYKAMKVNICFQELRAVWQDINVGKFNCNAEI